MKDSYLTPTQLAKALGISRQAVLERIQKGSIAATKVGQQYIIDRKVLSGVKTEGRSVEGTLKRMERSKNTKERVLKTVRDNKINTMQLWFVDILGILKCVVITERELEEALDHGKGFDGSSVTDSLRPKSPIL